MMAADFDLEGFMEDIKGSKPPFKCPLDDCGKSYKTMSGISQHVSACSQENKAEASDDDKPLDLPQTDLSRYFISTVVS